GPATDPTMPAAAPSATPPVAKGRGVGRLIAVAVVGVLAASAIGWWASHRPRPAQLPKAISSSPQAAVPNVVRPTEEPKAAVRKATRAPKPQRPTTGPTIDEGANRAPILE